MNSINFIGETEEYTGAKCKGRILNLDMVTLRRKWGKCNLKRFEMYLNTRMTLEISNLLKTCFNSIYHGVGMWMCHVNLADIRKNRQKL